MSIHRKGFFFSLVVTIGIFAGELVGGIVSNSLALLSDAGHVLTDAFALGLSLIALLIMKKPSDFRATYGYQRIGLLAALINGVSLVIIAIFIYRGLQAFTCPARDQLISHAFNSCCRSFWQSNYGMDIRT